MNKLLRRDYDQFTGITEETWHDEEAGTITLRRFQDVEHTLAMNKVLYNEHRSKKPTFTDVKGDHGMYHKARIPFIIIEKWLREDGFNWFTATPAERKAKLNDGDNRGLLVRPGKL
jgi:hypothetical protein